MKLLACVVMLLSAAVLQAADLPTVSIEHMYYLQARAERVRRYKPDDMIEYCLAQKVGGAAFDYFYSQIFTNRATLARLLEVEGAEKNDGRVLQLTKTNEMFTHLLREEAVKVQNGMTREGQIASDSLDAMARAQNAR